MRSKSLGSGMLSVAYLLVLVNTGIALLLMPQLVNADWPGWTSSMVGFAILGMPVVGLLVSGSGSPARIGRWIGVLVIAAVAVRIVWSLYDAGSRAAFAAIAISPLLVLLLVAVLLFVYSWPWATTRALADAAQARGWTAYRELPPDLDLPGTALPLPVGRRWVVRNVVRTPDGAAFEVRWLEWHGLLCRRRRLAVFVGARLPVALPWLQVVPGRALTRSDLSLESAEFNRSFDVLGEDSRYLMAMLQPRAMQLLLDAKPVGLVVAGDALVAYDEQGLTPESLVRGVTAVQRLTAILPRHVLDQWGTNRTSSAGLRFAQPERKVTQGLVVLRLLATSLGLIALALAAVLAAAAAESQSLGVAFEPKYSVGTLLVAVLVLAAAAVGCGYLARSQGSEVA